MRLLIAQLLLLMTPFFASAQTQDELLMCHQYLEVSERLQCGKNNFINTFAFKYCQKFLDREVSFSEQAKIYLPMIRYCILEKATQDIKLSCQNAKRKIFEATVSCSVEHGYCHLGLKDRLRSVALFSADLWRPKLLETALRIDLRCLSR